MQTIFLTHMMFANNFVFLGPANNFFQNLATSPHFDAKGKFITLARTLSSLQIAECDLELIKLIH